MKILIVDDNSSKVMSIRNVISSSFPNAEIDVALTIFDAKRNLRNKALSYDLMILDLCLPLNDNSQPNLDSTLSFINEIKRSDDKYSLPYCIIGLTAYDELEVKARSDFQKCAWVIINYSIIEDSWKSTIIDIIEHISKHNNNHEVDVCVLTALHSPEAEVFKEFVNWNWSLLTPIGDKILGYKGFFTDKDGIKRTVILCSSIEMGLIHSSILTTKLIQLIRPRIIVMSGVCAGVKNRCNLGDVVIAKSSWNYDEGKRYIDEDGYRFIPSVMQVNINKNLNHSLQAYIINFENPFVINQHFDNGDIINDNLKIHRAMIASGSSVLSDSLSISKLYESNRMLLGVDMETVAFYTACDQSDYNIDYFSAKSVCDFGDSEKNDEYQKYSSFTSAKSIEIYLSSYYSFI